MKILIASDIHGSAYYLKKVLEKFKEEKADKIVLLGDIYNHGLEIRFLKIMRLCKLPICSTK